MMQPKNLEMNHGIASLDLKGFLKVVATCERMPDANYSVIDSASIRKHQYADVYQVVTLRLRQMFIILH